ncbi:hypothetical protein MASR2M36_39200 [Providencia sp.]
MMIAIIKESNIKINIVLKGSIILRMSVKKSCFEKSDVIDKISVIGSVMLAITL